MVATIPLGTPDTDTSIAEPQNREWAPARWGNAPAFPPNELPSDEPSAAFSGTDSGNTRASEKRRQSKSPRVDQSAYHEFRNICNDLIFEVSQARQNLIGNTLADSGMPAVVKVEELLERLFDCNWGQGDALKRIAVAIESQVKNAEWTERHVSFLEEFVGFMATRYMIDDSLVADCIETIKQHELNPFRGTIAETSGLKKYKIVEVV